MNDIADILGSKMPAALGKLDAAGISYTVELLRSSMEIRDDLDGKGANDTASLPQEELRVVRQSQDKDGRMRLWVCRIPETGQEHQHGDKRNKR